MWLIFAFLSAFFAGITAVLAKIGIRNTDSDVATAIRTIVVLIFSWIIAFLTGGVASAVTIDTKTLCFLILSGVATGASWLCYFKALGLGDVSRIAPIDKSSTVLTMLLAFIILNEPVTPYKLAAVALITAGTLMMAIRKAPEGGSAPSKAGAGWLVYALLSAVFASLTAIFGKVGINGIDPDTGTAIRTGIVLVMAWLMVFIKGKTGEAGRIDRRSLVFILFSGITTGLSWLCYYRALKDGEAGIVVPVDKLSIVVTVIFSRVALGERLSLRALCGLVVLVAGTLVLLL